MQIIFVRIVLGNPRENIRTSIAKGEKSGATMGDVFGAEDE